MRGVNGSWKVSMTVAKLIEELKKASPDLEVRIYDWEQLNPYPINSIEIRHNMVVID